MTTYYVDPAAGGSNNGSDWTNAWTSLQSAADGVVAGDVVYCRGHQDLAAAVDFDTAAATGSNAAGFVKFIGCNAGGTVDGTRFTLHCNGQSIHGIAANGSQDMVWLENIEIYGSAAGSYDGINYAVTATVAGWVLINCSIHNMGRHGFYLQSQDLYLTIIRSTFYSNGTSGVHGGANAGSKYLFCSFHDNASWGVYSSQGTYFGCLFYDNGDDGICVLSGNLLINCVIDQNADDGITSDGWTSIAPAIVIGCRITNQSGQAADIGFNASSEAFVYGWNYIFHNGDNIANDTISTAISVNGTDTNTIATEDSGNVDTDGYASVTDGSEDYNLASDALHRRTAITIPTS